MTQVLLTWVTKDKKNGFNCDLNLAQPEILQSFVISWWRVFQVLYQFLGNAQVLVSTFLFPCDILCRWWLSSYLDISD